MGIGRERRGRSTCKRPASKEKLERRKGHVEDNGKKYEFKVSNNSKWKRLVGHRRYTKFIGINPVSQNMGNEGERVERREKNNPTKNPDREGFTFKR